MLKTSGLVQIVGSLFEFSTQSLSDMKTFFMAAMLLRMLNFVWTEEHSSPSMSIKYTFVEGSKFIGGPQHSYYYVPDILAGVLQKLA